MEKIKGNKEENKTLARNVKSILECCEDLMLINAFCRMRRYGNIDS